ncbi:MAG TPA: hypothetical protein PKD05_24155, partial [Candidatus Melainabacteria bacterium]|nr:hypothetical protein [Candidatus Melainabacteria bacterium]
SKPSEESLSQTIDPGKSLQTAKINERNSLRSKLQEVEDEMTEELKESKSKMKTSKRSRVRKRRNTMQNLSSSDPSPNETSNASVRKNLSSRDRELVRDMIETKKKFDANLFGWLILIAILIGTGVGIVVSVTTSSLIQDIFKPKLESPSAPSTSEFKNPEEHPFFQGDKPK